MLTARKIKGWNPDRPDQRDHLFSAHHHWFQTLPSSVDLRPLCPPVYDQGQLGSCTANAIAAALEFDAMKQGEVPVTPSRLMIYYDERDKEGTVASDAGASIRDGIKSVNVQGACAETEWPYDISQYTVEPPANCYADALKHRSLSYERIPRNLTQMKACLAAGYPFVIGFSVYESFESSTVAATGLMPMPAHGEASIGGHAVLVVGYEDAGQVFIVRNSWSAEWADHGYFYMPYAYLLSSNLSSDFWTIRTVE
jgi:C1A family cysteine protease